MAAEAWNETQHELRKRVALMAERGHLDRTTAEVLGDESLAAIAAAITIGPPEMYAEHMEKARRRIPRDPGDSPTVALALGLNCGIWTADQDFFGCGLPVWTTETLQLYLDAEGNL
jgi:predicted nucleic acid-binding protein